MSGFTLIELLIVIAIAAILAAIAVPSFKTMIRNMAVRSAANDLVADIQFARSEATRANRAVSLAFDGRTWQVFTTNASGNRELLRTGSYSEPVEAQDDTLWFEFAPTGLITSSANQFPTGICLETADTPPVQRRVLFPARAASPVIQVSCQ